MWDVHECRDDKSGHWDRICEWTIVHALPAGSNTNNWLRLERDHGQDYNPDSKKAEMGYNDLSDLYLTEYSIKTRYLIFKLYVCSFIPATRYWTGGKKKRPG